MTIPDALPAIRAYLLANSALATLVGNRVFVPELPPTEAQYMPRAAVVLSPSGGPGSNSYMQVNGQRLDVRCYGPTAASAMAIFLAAHEALKQMVPNVTGGVRLFNAVQESGAAMLRDPDTRWPHVLSVYQVRASEVAAA